MPSMITTGLGALDAAIGGIPAQRTTMVRGDSRSGKTTLCLVFCRERLEQNEATCIISTMTSDLVSRLARGQGIDVSSQLRRKKLKIKSFAEAKGQPTDLLVELFSGHETQNVIIDTFDPLAASLSADDLANTFAALAFYKMTCLLTTSAGLEGSAMAPSRYYALASRCEAVFKLQEEQLIIERADWSQLNGAALPFSLPAVAPVAAGHASAEPLMPSSPAIAPAVTAISAMPFDAMTEPVKVSPRTIEPRTIEPRTIEPRTVAPRTVAPRAVEPNPADAPTEPHPADAPTAPINPHAVRTELASADMLAAFAQKPQAPMGLSSDVKTEMASAGMLAAFAREQPTGGLGAAPTSITVLDDDVIEEIDDD